MKYLILVFFALASSANTIAQKLSLTSPDNKIIVNINNNEKLSYAITFEGKAIMAPSLLGFEFKDEPPMNGLFNVVSQNKQTINEIWKPVVKSKHAEIINNYNELAVQLKEKTGLMRCMDIVFRAFNDGVAFRYKLYRSENIGNRKISRELTSFQVPGNPDAWMVDYQGYSSPQEAEFFKHKISNMSDTSKMGLPFLMDYGNNCWVAITEANINNYSGFYVGKNTQTNALTTKLAPLPHEKEDGVKVEFDDELLTPWRVLMIGNSPGTLIESEIVQNLNEPCKINDPTWIVPGTSAWDNWWSGDVKMEMPVIKKYIDFAAEMGWPYMLVDWQWYGKFNSPDADITKPAPQIDMSEIIRYAKNKNVRILLWLYSKDVNRNSAYKAAFPLFKQWGIAGVKIDFMDRDDQQMVNWYRDIIQCAAENQLLVDLHGAYKPDGIIRTYPNMITREGVMGNEYYKLSNKMSAAHNVKLAFTRMLAGQMDYTPGGFLNVTQKNFKNQLPTLVSNTRAAELSKFVIYESPLRVVSDHPDHILNQPGADFLKIVPTVWDDTHFISGYPEDYIALARRNGPVWYLGVMNNSQRKQIEVKLDFLAEGKYEMEIWQDTKASDEKPVTLQKITRTVKKGDSLKVALAVNGGYVAVIRKK